MSNLGNANEERQNGKKITVFQTKVTWRHLIRILFLYLIAIYPKIVYQCCTVTAMCFS